MNPCPWEIETIPDSASLFRLVHVNMIKVRPESRIPSDSMFVPDSDGMSADWDKHSSPEDSLIRTGLTFRPNTSEFKDPQKFKVFSLNVGEIRLLEDSLTVTHTPVFHGEPPPVGNPNNWSHSSTNHFKGDDVEVRRKLRNAALEVSVDMEIVQLRVESLRALGAV